MEEVPLITWTQKLVLYETKARYYIVGSNKSETRFRVLKIDRTEPKELNIHDDKIEYSRSEIHSVLSMVDGGNKLKKQGNNTSGLSKNISAFGIAGFVRFLEGYYIILITKRKKAAMIGPHTIYKVEDTSMIYIPNDAVRYIHPDESRYVKIFQNFDLSSNFYFSYSYDLTHTLQFNMAAASPNMPGCPRTHVTKNKTSKLSQSSLQPLQTIRRSPPKVSSLWKDGSNAEFGTLPAGTVEMREEDFCKEQVSTEPCTTGHDPNHQEQNNKKEPSVYGIKNMPCRKFVWNNHLLKGFESRSHPDWILYIIHGFIGQSNVCVFGKSVYLTLIGRRSNQFAGTRFLKRGVNLEGYVANEIETEQIVQDTAMTFLDRGKVAAFVQLRGSVPLFWSQDTSKIVPKPTISLDQRDPYSSAAGMHFNQLLCRYGAPVIVLNLVKTRENKQHESILSNDYISTIEYLNQFLPAEHQIQYIGFDMARVNKRKDADVMLRLNRIAKYCIKQNGFFLSVQPSQAQYLLKDTELQTIKGVWGPTGCRQAGIVRTNCVDCLDRTNTAQFALGRCALAYQLYAMGVLESPHLQFDTDCMKMLEELYEDHGDTVALQYGGSQLVHRIKGYRKIAPWTSHSRDIMQTLSRYYSNAFSDVEKQQAFNLFLGVFIAVEGQPNLWDLPTDYYLHNKASLGVWTARNHYCQWWDQEVWGSLPLPNEEVCKSKMVHAAVLSALQTDEHVNPFYEHYRPEELTSFDDMYQMYLAQVCWKHMPKNATDLSPFCVRHSADTERSLLIKATPVIRRSHRAETNPNISGKDSASLNASLGSEGSSDTSEDSDVEGGVQLSASSDDDDSSGATGNYLSFKDIFPSMKAVYDTEITDPNTRDQKLYERYVDIGQGQKSCSTTCEKMSGQQGSEVKEKTVADTSRREEQQGSEVKEKTAADTGRQEAHQEATDSPKRAPPGIDIFPISAFKLDSTFFVEPPPVSRQARDLYAAYVQRGLHGAGPVSDADRHAYIKYVNRKYL